MAETVGQLHRTDTVCKKVFNMVKVEDEIYVVLVDLSWVYSVNSSDKQSQGFLLWVMKVAMLNIILLIMQHSENWSNTHSQ